MSLVGVPGQQVKRLTEDNLVAIVFPHLMASCLPGFQQQHFLSSTLVASPVFELTRREVHG